MTDIPPTAGTTDIYIARDGTTDGLPGNVFLYQGKPQWIEAVRCYQGNAQGCLSEYRRKLYPIQNGEMARLVIDPSTVAPAATCTTAGSASGDIGESVNSESQ